MLFFLLLQFRVLNPCPPHYPCATTQARSHVAKAKVVFVVHVVFVVLKDKAKQNIMEISAIYSFRINMLKHINLTLANAKTNSKISPFTNTIYNFLYDSCRYQHSKISRHTLQASSYQT